MKILHRTRTEFPIAHVGADSTHNHAHVLTVLVESHLNCETETDAILDEFRERELSQMLPAGGDIENLAAYIHDRLTGFSVQAIDVWLDGIGVRLEW